MVDPDEFTILKQDFASLLAPKAAREMGKKSTAKRRREPPEERLK